MLAGHFPRPIVEEIRRAKKSEQVMTLLGLTKNYHSSC
jgi:hypothetical protein